MNITTNLGDSRPVEKVYEDGSFNCPFCGYGVHNAGKAECTNPGCEANPYMPVALILERREAAAKRIAEDEQRKRNAEWSRQYARQQETARDEIRQEAIAKAKENGNCLSCLFKSPYKFTFVTHRKVCPRAA